MKRSVLTIVGSIVLVFSASAIGYVRINRAQQKRMEQKREAMYQSALSLYSEDLKTGTTRKDVEDYLRARNTQFQTSGTIVLVQIAEENPPWFCSDAGVYVAFEFVAVETHKDSREHHSSDVLNKASIYRRSERCL